MIYSNSSPFVVFVYLNWAYCHKLISCYIKWLLCFTFYPVLFFKNKLITEIWKNAKKKSIFSSKMQWSIRIKRTSTWKMTICVSKYTLKRFSELWNEAEVVFRLIKSQSRFCSEFLKKYTSLKVLWRNYKEEWLFPKTPINKQIPALFQTPFSSTDWGRLKHLNSQAVCHSYKDKLVLRLTVNGFGPLINCDRWELIHNPLCSWPLCAVSGAGYKDSSRKLSHWFYSGKRQTTAPHWPQVLTDNTARALAW